MSRWGYIRRRALGVVALCLAGVVTPRVGAEILEPGRLESARLPNGWQIAACNIPELPLVYVGIFHSLGSADDPDDYPELMHLIEHLVFSDRRYAPQLALNTCYANAMTAPEMTWYESICIPSLLPQVLQIEADRHRSFEPSQQELDRERNVVLAETAHRWGLDSGGHLKRLLLDAAYGWRTPAFGAAIGKVTLEGVVTFYRERVARTRHALVIVGPMAAGEVIALARSRFATLPVTSLDSLPSSGPVAVAAESTVTLDRRDEPGFWLGLGYRVATSTAEERSLALFASAALDLTGGGVPLWRGRRASLLVVGTHFQYRRAPFGSVSYSAEHDASLARERVSKRVEGRVDSITTPTTFVDIRYRALLALERAFKNPEVCMLQLGSALVLDGNVEWLRDVDRALVGLQVQDIQAFLEEGVSRGPVATAVVHGRNSGRKRATDTTVGIDLGTNVLAADPFQELDAASIRAVLEQDAAARVPKPITRTLSNGVRYTSLVVPGSSQLLLGGLKTFPPLESERSGKQRGLCALHSMMLNYGDASRWPFGALPYDAAFEVSPWELRFASKGALPSAGGVAFVLVKELLQPEFDPQVFRFFCNNSRVIFMATGQPAEVRARKARWSRLFGEAHPVLGAFEGDPDIGSGLNFSDLQEFHDRITEPGNMQWFAVGDVEAAVVDSVYRQTLGSMSGPKAVKWKTPKPPKSSGPAGDLITAGDSRDVTLTLAFGPAAIYAVPQITWSEARLTAAYVEARLSQRLRLERGLVYFVQAVVLPIGGFAVMEIETAALPTRGAVVMAILCDEARRLCSEPIDRSALDRSRLSEAGAVIRALSDQESALDLLCEMGRYGDPEVAPVESIVSIPAERVQDRLLRWLSPGVAAFTVIGPPEIQNLQPFVDAMGVAEQR